VTRHLYVPPDSAFFFRYFMTSAAGTTSALANSALPVYWDDSLARDDSITAVQLRATGVFYDTRARANVYRNLYTSVKLRNALRLQPPNCGTVPSQPASLTVSVDAATAGQKLDVQLNWSAVAGDSTPPRNVREYVVYRRLNGATSWSVIGSKPARGATAYRYLDFALPIVAGNYQYGLAARHCSGLSAITTGSALVTFP
jgi:hypothetical protein